MKAIIVKEDNSLAWEDIADPEPGPNDVLIRNLATSVNRADLAQRAGTYQPPPGTSEIMGLDCVGIIKKVGANVKKWKVGQKVCALLPGGSYAELVSTNENNCIKIPPSLNLKQAAAVTEVFATAYLNLIMLAGLRENQSCLVHAGASGVGTAAIQICKVLNINCFVTAGTEEKLDFCLGLGAKGGAIRDKDSFSSLAKEWTGKQGFNAILDPVGGSYLEENIKSLATDGSLVCIGIMGGRSAELDMGRLLVKRLTVKGSTLRSRSIEEKTVLLSNMEKDLWHHFEDGQLQAIIDSAFPITDVEEAHQRMQANLNTGKIILLLPGHDEC